MPSLCRTHQHGETIKQKYESQSRKIERETREFEWLKIYDHSSGFGAKAIQNCALLCPIKKKAKIWETNCRKNYDQLEWKSILDGFKKIIFGPFSQNFPIPALLRWLKKSYTHAWQLYIKRFKKLKINRIVGSKKSA